MAEIQEKTLYIDGMTCTGCENRIEKKLRAEPGVRSTKASYSNGTVAVAFDPGMIGLDKITELIEQLDYKVKSTSQNAGQKTKYAKILGVALVLFALYMLINRFGGLNIFNAFPEAEEGMSYGMLFVIGLLTSVHCVAMCGGINLSQCVPQRPAQQTEGGKFSALTPSILYNLGRVISYTVIGGIVGAIGSVISFSGAAKGIVQLAAGVFMVIMGLNMLNIFPWLRKLNPRMPKIFARKINSQKRSNSPLYVGLLNGLMPCGPLQAMQLYALSTGNFFSGALSMFLFSLGTVPLMFSLGALSSILSRKFTARMMRFSAVLVVGLGVSMFSSGMSLSGFSVSAPVPAVSASGNIAQIQNDVQIVTSRVLPGQYQPITVQKGIPVRWTLQADEGSINGCNNRILIPEYGLEKRLEPGENVVEFTPEESGSIPFSCWMGMIRSRIIVVDDLNDLPAAADASGTAEKKIPTDKIAIAKIQEGMQSVSIDMDENGFSPAVVVMQKGLETVWNINGQKITPGNASVLFPVYYAEIDMTEGENSIRLVPEADFDFYTADNVFYGYVKVVDDLTEIDPDAIRREVGQFIPAADWSSVDNVAMSCCN
mgnify:CR=1 FL=1